MLVICACLAGAASSVRELVKERAIYIRERAAGLSSGAYLSSKLLVLGVISILQSFILVLIGLAGRPIPPTGPFLTGAPLVEVLLGIAVLALASMCLGLFVSALVSTSEKAMPFLVLLTMVQVILSGGVLSLSGKAGLSSSPISRRPAGGSARSRRPRTSTSSTPAGQLHRPAVDAHSATWLRDMGCMIGSR